MTVEEEVTHQIKVERKRKQLHSDETVTLCCRTNSRRHPEVRMAKTKIQDEFRIASLDGTFELSSEPYPSYSSI